MMGRYGGLFIVSIMILSACNSRHIASDSVPSIVRNIMAANYPGVQNVDWEKHNNYYEAEADLNDSTELSIQISQAGTIIMKKQDIGIDKLPSSVMTHVNVNYKTYMVDDAEQLEKNSTVYYQLELTARGKKDINLIFTKDGLPEKNVAFWD